MLGPGGQHPPIGEENQSGSGVKVEQVSPVTAGMSWAPLVTVGSPEAQPGVPHSTYLHPLPGLQLLKSSKSSPCSNQPVSHALTE